MKAKHYGYTLHYADSTAYDPGVQYSLRTPSGVQLTLCRPARAELTTEIVGVTAKRKLREAWRMDR